MDRDEILYITPEHGLTTDKGETSDLSSEQLELELEGVEVVDEL